MFENVKNTQAVADRLKALLPSNTPAQRRDNEAVYPMLHQFENARWDADAMTQAVNTTREMGLEIAVSPADKSWRFILGEWRFILGDRIPPAATVAYLIGTYMALIHLSEKAADHAE